MKIIRIYATDDGESHFGEVEIEMSSKSDIGQLSAFEPATGVLFRETPADYDFDWHNAPRRQSIVNLNAGVEIEVSDGEVRRIGAGEVFLVEDTKGRGHKSRSIGGTPRRSLFIALDSL